MQQEEPPVLYFDGVCNLCNRFVTFFIKHDVHSRFRFASLQSKAGQQARDIVATRHQKQIDSVILYHKGKYYYKSEAALKAIAMLNGGWRLAKLLLVFPKSLRDAVYDLIAVNRYRWFGRRNHCLLPGPGLKERFLED